MSNKEKSVCETCGRDFEYYRSTLRGKSGRFCSKKCIRLSANSGSFIDQGKFKEIQCETCGKIFNGYNRKYCSQDCFQLVNDSARLLPKPRYGADNPAWKGGVVSEARKERTRFAKQISHLVFERDDYTCQICGAVGGTLHADHLDRWCDHEESRFDVSNCRTLCRPCHYLVTYGRPMPEGSKWGYYKLNKQK